jgi:hypothetical protein
MQLQNLELAHFQSNRLTGVITLRSEFLADDSSFISDCGVPTQFEGRDIQSAIHNENLYSKATLTLTFHRSVDMR